MHARHACMHARTHMHNAARTRRRRRRTARCDMATARGNARRREVPAGCACAAACAAARAASPGVRFKELCPKAASPAGPHVPFWDTAPPFRRGGSLTSNRTGPLRPGGLCPAQASVASFHFGVRSFADDPSLSGGILVGSAVPSLQSPEIHPRLWHLPCSRAGPQLGGGRTGEGVLGWGLGSGPPPRGLLTCSDVPCVLLMWMT